MEILVGVGLAIIGMIWAFFRGKGSQKRTDLKDKVEKTREEIDEETAEADKKIEEAEAKVADVDDRLAENETREVSDDEAVDLLSDHYGWGDRH